MDNLARMLENARFYGAKSEAIDSIDVVREAPAAGGTLMVLRVHHGGRSDLYQVLVDAEGSDVLADADVATDYGAALLGGEPAGFGGLHTVADLPGGLTGRMISGEQSNTSLIFSDDTADRLMVKVFRKLEPGVNPDVELLSKIPDCPNVAPVLGWVTEEIDGEDHVLAMVQDFVADARDGWKFALGFAALDASFGAEAALLGEATRAVHTALADAFPTEEVPATELTRSLEEHLDHLVARAPVLEPYADAARERYRALGDGTHTVQRIHGDLHLGQVLRAPEAYVLIDFEGEPARPLAERRRPDSALRDVAGIIRSLDYAAHFHSHSGEQGPAAPAEWAAGATREFLAGYGVGASPLLDAYVLDKALYEVVYESDNRPGWVDIPLEAVKRLVG
ncbi:phosphotransferase [Corynebacterium halotolerans]|uniref:Uncharacterized protein n=1 Tax=Corynebacterium halotolerans YIM 70093 = DSM 44683 TaxID=1121362 RepID=M1MZH5_9CORY|nr:phosphotransferase [Corynebacterium halotolerans]AGF73104.1 hypothetical protein A605_10520 [Corynebacterium halotolerans YIM 70093 = DSM 44683]